MIRSYAMQNISSGKSVVVLLALILALTLTTFAGQAKAGTLEMTPRISVKYNYNDNMYGQDLDELDAANMDPVSASYLDYLVGITFVYQDGRSRISVGGDAGYEQFISMDGWVMDSDTANVNVSDYDFFTISGNVIYSYSGRNVMFSLRDEITQTRSLEKVFGENTDAIGYWSLYTNNLASASVKFNPMGKVRTLLEYQYATLIFSDPEAENVSRPSDSYSHNGIVRNEIDFTGKTTGIIDAQYSTNVIEEVDNVDYVDFDRIQAMIGLRYKIDSNSSIEVLGGYGWRNYSDVTPIPLPAPWPAGTTRNDIEDMADPLASLLYQYTLSKKVEISLRGTQGISTYGQDLFFVYTSGNGRVTYFVTPKINLQFIADYRQATYDMEKNNKEWMWDEDRIDRNTRLEAIAHYDILQKGGQGTLSIEGGYRYQLRDSNLDSPEAYNDIYASIPGANVQSYDSTINYFYFQVQVLPTILIGK